MTKAACPNCDSENAYRTSEPVSAGGGYAPNYLPGLAGFLGSSKVHLVVCRDCGLMRVFAAPEALERLGESKKWQRIEVESPSDW